MSDTNDYGQRRKNHRHEAPKGNVVAKGRNTHPNAVPEVSTVPCAARDDDGPHRLTNTRQGKTRCEYCRRSWADLDAAIRPAATPEHA
jgi:hypothetical protein